MTISLAEKIYNHLLATKQGFCFYQGQLISLGDCERVLNIDSNVRYVKTLSEASHD